MPRNQGNDKRARKGRKPTPDDEDSSVDSHGNIRNLIDYDYEENSDEELFEMEDTPKGPRKAKQVAARRLRKLMKLTPDSDVPKKQKPTLLIRDEDEDEAPKKKSAARRRKARPEEGKFEDDDDDDIVVPKRRKALKRKVVEESEDDEEEEEVVKKPRKLAKRKVVEEESEEEEVVKKPRKSKRKVVEESEEEEEFESSDEDDEEDEEDEDDDDDDDDDDEDDDEDDEEDKPRRGIDIIISDMLGGRDANKPRKYNMKKESASVKRFVELVQKEEEEEDNIDNDITYFKSLTGDKQNTLLKALEYKASPAEVQVPLKFKILEKVAVKPELNRIAMAKYSALCNLDPSSSEYYKCGHWISGFTDLPLGIYRDLPVKIEDGAEKCGEFMTGVHKAMESAIYGHDEAKLQILQFVSSWIANPKAHGNVLSIHGPMGVGKTTLIKNGVAKALERPFHFITLGGATDASFLDGHSYTYEGSTWGKIADVLIQSKCMNPIIYFDELDKVSETPKGDEIMNLLIHLTDGSQNDRFQDKYFTGIDFDLSRCLFIFSHNNHEKVNPILRDRMYNIAVKGFSLKDKLLIAENYLLPEALRESGLFEKVNISKEILQYIVENFTGGEGGVRELKRCIQTIASKLNLLRFYNNPKQVPFAIEGFSLPFILKKSHIDLFLKKKEEMDASIAHLYT